MVTWQDLLSPEPARADQLFTAWIAPEEIRVLFESHAVKTACNLDKSRSPFGGGCNHVVGLFAVLVNE